MSVDNRGLVEFQGKLARFRDDVPQIMERLAVGEGVYAARQAKIIAKNDNPDIVNTGHYRNNFHTGNKALGGNEGTDHDGSRPRRSGHTYTIDVYNNLDYAKPLEYGFRSHFVPGEWQGKTFVYAKGAKGGMYVGPRGGFVQGHFALRRAIKRTKDTQNARLGRKLEKIIKDGMK